MSNNLQHGIDCKLLCGTDHFAQRHFARNVQLITYCIYIYIINSIVGTGDIACEIIYDIFYTENHLPR